MALSVAILSEFNGKGIAKARKEFEQLEGAGAKAGFVLKKAMLPATAALGGLATMAADTVSAASDLNESINAVNVTFGEAADEILKMGEAAAKTVGLSRTKFNALAVQFSSFARKIAGPTGKVEDVLDKITRRAADFASVMNLEVAEAARKFQSGLAGEAEPLKQFGIDLSETAIKAYAVANNIGIITAKGVALTEAEKVLARYGSLMEQTQATSGDFANTSDGLANSQRILKEQMENTKAAIGQGLLPIIESVLPYLQEFADWAAENPETFRNIAAAIGAIAAATVALNAAMAVNPYVAAAAGIVAMALAFEKLYTEVSKINKVGGLAARAFGFVFGGAAGKLGSMLKINDLIFDLVGVGGNTTGAGVGGLGGGRMAELKGVPGLANGGIVTGPTLALIGEAGPEAVIPLDRMGSMGAGTTVNINVHGGDPNAVVDALRRYMQLNGSVPIRVRST